MRRTQVDTGSKPVRNLAGNPAMLSTNSGMVIRTNLATDPRATRYGAAAVDIGWLGGRWFGSGAGVGTYTIVTGAVDGPLPELTSYARKTWTSSTLPSSNSDTGFNISNGFNAVVGSVSDSALKVTAGLTYTFSAYLRATTAKSSVQFDIVWRDVTGLYISRTIGTAFTLSAGQWGRISHTAAAPAGATQASVVIDPDGGTLWAQNDTLDGTGLLIEQLPALSTYFDGATPAAGDFTYNWSGSAHYSTSRQVVTALAALQVSRNTSMGAFYGYQSTAEDGKKVAKWVAPANTGSSSWRVAGFAASSMLGWTPGPVKAGGRYTLLIRFRGSGWGAGQQAQIMIADGGATNAVIGFDTAQTLNTTGWVDYRRTFTAVRDATTGSTIYISLPTSPQTATDGVFEVREWMLVEGEYNGDFIDGSKPFSKWDGTANASTSIGYPQQLLDIAGKPTSDLVGVGSVDYTVSDPFAARTVYFVYETYGQASNYYQQASYGIANTNGFNLQTQVAGNNSMSPRFDFIGGSSNVSLGGLSTHRTIGRHVIALTFEQGLTTARYCGDGGPDYTNTAMNPATSGWNNGRLAGTYNATNGGSLRVLAYYANHDRATRVAISRYLGNKYGANVA